ncbi:hypothetical protein PIROE2DRAFT_64009 [Piromyces sp. E2]|nr:hypothetical protein PIROE2DRAFT_64009 [Piromyces sp. E2]|eukprot:OUM59070.1 hypothetical protein PIROE2DRAFT_64009 [Piromyces sp. E2]
MDYTCLVPYRDGNSNGGAEVDAAADAADAAADAGLSFTIDNSACFYGNDQAYCVDSENTSFKECNMSNSKTYNYDICMAKIFNFTKKNGIQWSKNFISYPNVKKYVNTLEVDRKNCMDRSDGIFVNNGENENEYVCLSSHYEKDERDDTYCIYATTNKSSSDSNSNSTEDSTKDVFCINYPFSRLELCNKANENSNYRLCYKKILDMSKDKLYNLEPYF